MKYINILIFQTQYFPEWTPGLPLKSNFNIPRVKNIHTPIELEG
jgi:hypothetical protein